MSKKRKKGTLFEQIESTTNVSEQKIRSLASKVHPDDLSNEKKVRQLISQVSAMAGLSVSKEKEDQIVNYLVKNKASMQEIQAMVQMFLQPKR